MRNLDLEIQAAKKEIAKYRQARRTEKLRLRKAIARSSSHKGHDNSRFTNCPVYQKFRDSGIDHFTADQICKQAAKYKINQDLNLTQIMNEIKNRSAFAFDNKDSNGVGFQDNKSNSKGPDTGAIPDRQYPDSSYGNDYDSCVKSLSDPVEKGGLGIDLERAKQECDTQWKGVGSRGGQTRSASISPAEVPAWVWTVLTPGEIQSIESKMVKPSHFRSAADESRYRNYIEAITEPIGERLSRRANERVKSANLKEEDDKIPYWARLAGFTG